MNVYVVTEQEDNWYRIVAVAATRAGAEKHVDALLGLPGAVGAYSIAKWRVLQEWEASDV